jgi:hypothetical protein
MHNIYVMSSIQSYTVTYIHSKAALPIVGHSIYIETLAIIYTNHVHSWTLPLWTVIKKQLVRLLYVIIYIGVPIVGQCQLVGHYIHVISLYTLLISTILLKCPIIGTPTVVQYNVCMYSIEIQYTCSCMYT